MSEIVKSVALINFELELDNIKNTGEVWSS